MIDLKDSKRICVKLSGGADSAIVLYLICKKITEENIDIEYILPSTVLNRSKPFNFYYASQILDWMAEKFPNINFKEMETNESQSNDDYVDAQVELTHRLLSEDRMDCIFSGITLVPKDKKFTSSHNGPYEERTIENLEKKKAIFSNASNTWFLTPFWDKDKKDIYHIYKENDLLDTLFPLTRSCEGFVSMEKHCGDCWHCNERMWAFGRLE